MGSVSPHCAFSLVSIIRDLGVYCTSSSCIFDVYRKTRSKCFQWNNIASVIAVKHLFFLAFCQSRLFHVFFSMSGQLRLRLLWRLGWCFWKARCYSKLRWTTRKTRVKIRKLKKIAKSLKTSFRASTEKIARGRRVDARGSARKTPKEFKEEWKTRCHILKYTTASAFKQHKLHILSSWFGLWSSI